VPNYDHLRAAVFRLVAGAGLEACLEEGLAAAFFVAALAAVVLLSGVFALDAGVFEAGFFPVTSFLAVSRREDVVVFFVEAVLPVDFEEGFTALLLADTALVFALVVVAFALVAAFAGLAATLGSLASFFTAVFFVVSLVSLAADLLVVEDFAVLVAVVVDLDLVADLAGAFLVVVGLDTFAGLFSLVSISLFLVVFGGSLTRPERPLGR